ncbi:MAG: AraC family transcriptional regulator [Lachnospiraceae bacterium]|nr:AraC family transcriptional regulator [Lachnospiraceae bacterium]
MLKQLNETMDYIEAHLLEEEVIEQSMRQSCVSELHFKNLFFFLTGMTLKEYVRNRRLSEANYDLMNGGKVTDVALKYNYQSIDGFTRAFKNWCGFLPSEVRKQGECKVFSKLHFAVTMKGGSSMECRIVEKPAFYFVGVSKRVPMQYEGVNQEIVKLAQSITPEQRTELHRIQNMEPSEIVNVSHHSDTDFLREEGYLTHMIGVLTTEEEVGEGLEKLPMKAGTWDVFPNEGPFPFTLQNTESLSFSFTKMDSEKTDSAYSEIWIPVTRKKR